jgi:hypothetical protein
MFQCLWNVKCLTEGGFTCICYSNGWKRPPWAWINASAWHWKEESDAFDYPRCGTNLICCILYTLPKLHSGMNNVGINYIFHLTPHVKVLNWGLVTMVVKAQEPQDHDQSNIQDNAYLTTPVQPNWSVLEHHHQKLHPLSCVQQNIPNSWCKCLWRNSRYQGPVTFADKIQGPVRWYLMMPAHMFMQNRY